MSSAQATAAAPAAHKSSMNNGMVALRSLSDDDVAKLAGEECADGEARRSLLRLRDLQNEHNDLIDEYTRERMLLRQRFEKRLAPIFSRRASELNTSPLKDDFWYRAVDNCVLLRENVTERDAIALRYLRDIVCDTYSGPEPGTTSEKDAATVDSLESSESLSADRANGQGQTNTEVLSTDMPYPRGSFVLKFFFKDNPFFENDVLEKTYIMEPDDSEELAEAHGCTILWKKSMDLTVRTLKKKTKNGKILVKRQSTDSFFNFFSPPPAHLSPDGAVDPSLAQELEDVMDADYELSECIRADLIPRALHYYLGIGDIDEAEEEEDDDEDEEDEDDDDDDDDDDGDDKEGRRKPPVGASA